MYLHSRYARLIIDLSQVLSFFHPARTPFNFYSASILHPHAMGVSINQLVCFFPKVVLPRGANTAKVRWVGVGGPFCYTMGLCNGTFGRFFSG